MLGGAQLAGQQIGDLRDQGDRAQTEPGPLIGGVGTRCRTDAPDPTINGQRRILPADPAVGRGEHRGQRGQRIILRLRTHAVVLDAAQHIEDQGRPGLRQPLEQVPTGVPTADGLRESAIDGTGVEPLLEAEHACPSDLVACDDRPLDRCGSAPCWQQREVEIQPTVLWYLQQIGRHQAPVGDHDGDVDL